jgi:hypothetical protein
MIARDLDRFLQQYYSKHESISKTKIIDDVAKALELRYAKPVFFDPNGGYACRFSYSSTSGFSNTVLGLSRLWEFDRTLPFIVCVLRPKSYELFLANTTFLKKISHSSQNLTYSNIRGSFNGSDIMRAYNGIANTPENFNTLYNIHKEVDPSHNLSRLVAETNLIAGTKERFPLDTMTKQHIRHGVIESLTNSETQELDSIKNELDKRVDDLRERILQLAYEERDNVNIRGNSIEQLITRDMNSHNLEDLEFELENGKRVLIEIKTSIINRQSSPTFYNIDKLFAELSDGNTYFYAFVIFIDLDNKTVGTELVNCFDKRLLTNIAVQRHWSGRNSRGATQITSGFQKALMQTSGPILDVEIAEMFLEELWIEED